MLVPPTIRTALRAFSAAVFAALTLSACGVPRIPGITPYKMEIQQGNFVSQEMVSQLKPGMSKEQVKLILGTPLLTDIFHSERRWDYVYWKEDQAGHREQRKLVVFFEDGKLARLDGDVRAKEPQ
jgi:outer membrane protein assembly factor BamE